MAVYAINTTANPYYLDIPASGGGGTAFLDDQVATGSTVTAGVTFADMPGQPTWTVTAPAGTYMLVTNIRGIYGTGIGQFQVSLDGVPLSGSLGYVPLSANAYVTALVVYIVALDGAAHTFSIQWQAVQGMVSADQNFGGAPYGGRLFVLDPVG